MGWKQAARGVKMSAGTSNNFNCGWDNLPLEHGSPLVMKCDNGPAFRACATKRFLRDREIFTLYSPPYCARYNGACERANRTLKELTAHVADQARRLGFWTIDDLMIARLRAIG